MLGPPRSAGRQVEASSGQAIDIAAVLRLVDGLGVRKSELAGEKGIAGGAFGQSCEVYGQGHAGGLSKLARATGLTVIERGKHGCGARADGCYFVKGQHRDGPLQFQGGALRGRSIEAQRSLLLTVVRGGGNMTHEDEEMFGPRTRGAVKGTPQVGLDDLVAKLGAATGGSAGGFSGHGIGDAGSGFDKLVGGCGTLPAQCEVHRGHHNEAQRPMLLVVARGGCNMAHEEVELVGSLASGVVEGKAQVGFVDLVAVLCLAKVGSAGGVNGHGVGDVGSCFDSFVRGCGAGQAQSEAWRGLRHEAQLPPLFMAVRGGGQHGAGGCEAGRLLPWRLREWHAASRAERPRGGSAWPRFLGFG